MGSRLLHTTAPTHCRGCQVSCERFGSAIAGLSAKPVNRSDNAIATAIAVDDCEVEWIMQRLQDAWRLTTLNETDGYLSVLVIGLTDNLGQLLYSTNMLVPHQQQDCPQLQHTAEVCSCD
jgi:hypothetical protein